MPPKRPRSAPKKSKGLNKKEKTEVAKIAKASVKQVAEKKYMNTKTTFGDDNLVFVNPTRPVGNNYISCIGFSSTVGETDVGAAVTYGGQAVHDLMCLRPFTDSETDDTLKAFAPDGKFVQPVSCKTQWRLSRDFARIDPYGEPNVGGLTPEFPQSLAENCPIICRMIKCTANIPAGTATELDPDQDLFIDEYGRSTGTANANFDEREMLFYKVNKRRWSVLEDKKFKVLSPVTLQYQQSLSAADTRIYTPIISATNSNCEKYLVTHHQLSKRKNGKVYYDKYDNETNNATAGHRREYIFFHFSWQGADAITGPTETGETPRATGPTNINISCVNYTKFIDV